MIPFSRTPYPVKRLCRQLGRQSTIIIVCAVIPALYILFNTISFDIHQMGDSSGYMILALSLCEGNGFQLIARPDPIHFLWWPPGFPMFLAVFAFLFGPHWIAAKILIFCLTYAAVVAFGWLIYRKTYSLTAAVFVVTILSVNSFLHQQLSYLYSEAFYICVSVVFFLLWYRWKHSLSLTKAVLLSFIAVYVASIRNIGLALPVAFTLFLAGEGLLRRDFRSALRALIPFSLTAGLIFLFTTVPATSVGSFQVFFQGVPGYATPVEATDTGVFGAVVTQLAEYGKFVLHSVRSYALTLIPKLFMVSTYHAYVMNPWKALWGALVTTAVLIGFIDTFRRDTLQNLYIAVYGGVLLIYPALYSRLLVPILPFLAAFLYAGLVRTSRLIRLPRRARVVLFIPLWFLIVGDNAFWISTTPYRYMPGTVGDRNHQECLEWVIGNAEEGDVIVSQVDRYLFIRRGRYTVPIPDAHTPVEMISALEKVNADMVIVAPYFIPEEVYQILKHTTRTMPNRFQMLYGNPNNSTQVYRFYSEWDQTNE